MVFEDIKLIVVLGIITNKLTFAIFKVFNTQSNLQDTFLNSVRKSKNPVTLFLVNGVKLQGVITWFDNFSVLLRREGTVQLVYKHAISTIMPSLPLDLIGEDTEGD